MKSLGQRDTASGKTVSDTRDEMGSITASQRFAGALNVSGLFFF